MGGQGQGGVSRVNCCLDGMMGYLDAFSGMELYMRTIES